MLKLNQNSQEIKMLRKFQIKVSEVNTQLLDFPYNYPALEFHEFITII